MFDQFSSEAGQLLLEALASDRLPFLSVRSDSMAPLLRRGDQVQIGPAVASRLSEGDIIVLGTAEELLAHRYWGTSQLDGTACLLTRGDRLAYYDPITPESELRAIVIARRRSGRLLPLTHGPGAWLNRRLAQLSRLDAIVMRLPRPTSICEPGSSQKYGIARRIARRSLLTLTVFLSALVGLLPVRNVE